MQKKQIIQLITVFNLVFVTTAMDLNAQETNPDEAVLDQQIIEETISEEQALSDEIVVEAVEVPETLTSEEAVQSVNRASRAAVTYPATIESIFPDPVFATAVAQVLNKNVTDEVVKADLETVYNVNLVDNALTSLVGIEELSNLAGLTIMSTGIDDLSYVDWSKTPNIQMLQVMDVNITDFSKTGFHKLSNLQSLFMMNTQIESIDVDWSQMTNLMTLSIVRSKIKDIKNVNWTGLDNLMMLDLSFNEISDVGIAWSGMPKISGLNFVGNHITDLSKVDLSGLPTLVSFGVGMQTVLLDKEVFASPLVLDNVAIKTDGVQASVMSATEEGVYDATTGKITWNTLTETVTQVVYTWDQSYTLENNVQIMFSGDVTVPLGPGFDLIFKDYDDSILEQTLKAEGAKIVAPTVPDRPGYTFTGWTPSLDAVMPAQATEYVATYTKDATAPVVNDEVVTKPTVDLGRTCQDDGYPNGYYWNGNSCVVEPPYSVPNTGTK